ncbi:MAG: HIT domain-containing protein [Candidatus Thermoplasmatota archaeon]|nr:HIT domain-containing protein [Candidatus Thermoplasmatota archaeon]
MIASGAIPSYKVASNETSISFLDINPIARGHILVIPRKHFSGLDDVDHEAFAGTMELALRITRSISGGRFSEGTNLFVSNGEAADQTVKHLHVHIVPRNSDDNLQWNSWWLSKVKGMEEGEMADTLELIRKCME